MSDLTLFVHQNIALVSALGVVVVALVVFERVFAKRGVKELSTTDTTLKIKQKKSLVLDIRKSTEFLNGHIAQSKNIDAQDIPGKIKALAKTVDAPIVVICHSGISALSVARKIYKAGYTDVSILKGGIQAWLKEHLPLVSPQDRSQITASQDAPKRSQQDSKPKSPSPKNKKSTQKEASHGTH